MSETTSPSDQNAARACRRCAEPVAADLRACEFCGHPMPPRKPAAVRLAEVASLAAVLAVIIAGCRVLGNLLGI